ncbi:MAG: SDR family NAD(P)-dependent oxidoreductase [Dehalococcoidia bacterium]
MKDFAGKVAVVTGAASGMGLAFAHRFADEGMNIVLADIESEPLAMAEAAITAKGGKAIAVRTNVMHEDEMNRLADRAFSTFGNVHILCNNAGVAGGTQGLPVWEQPLSNWEWVLGVNFMGVLYGVRAFVPRMIENGEEGHIVTTASLAGLLTSANPYGVSKHGAVCLAEGLYKEFKIRGLKLSASVLCPGWVDTNIIDSERNRPQEFGPGADLTKLPPDARQQMEAVRGLLKGGFPPSEIAERVFEAVRDDQFYIIPSQPEFVDLLNQRLDDIRERRNPTIARVFDQPGSAAAQTSTNQGRNQ